jgi:hypothetical protein
MAKIMAPFSNEQVARLIKYQEGGRITSTITFDNGDTVEVPGHPLTCCGPDYCERKGLLTDRSLIPAAMGLVCPCGKYTQDWFDSRLIN